MVSNSRDREQPYVVLAGLDDARGVYAARALARHNVPVIGITRDKKCSAYRTNVCHQLLTVQTTSEELIEALEILGPTLARRAVIIPCLEMSMLLISRHRKRLSKWFHIVLPEPNVVEMFVDKVLFYKYAEQKGFPIPRTYFLHDRSDVEDAIAAMTFPCALKPNSTKTDLWLGHTHIRAFKIINGPELRAAFESHRRFADTLILQDWIEGGDDTHYAAFCYLNAEAQPLVTFTSRKVRQWPPQTGDTTLAEECSDDFVLNETLRLLQSVHFRGIAYVDIKRDIRSGKYFILDPNIGRTAAWMGIAEAAGVELLYTMYCDTIEAPLPTNRKQTFNGPKWMYLRKDIQSALHYWLRGNLTIKQWWSSLRGPKVDALLSWNDLGPFWYDIMRGLRLLGSPHAH
jgi:predicted ATP-grasp superfamily ATP-dependent carboligase